MTVNEYQSLLMKLKNKEITNLEVEPKDFMAFQKALSDFDSRKKVVGKAHLGGKVTYTYLFNA